MKSLLDTVRCYWFLIRWISEGYLKFSYVNNNHYWRLFHLLKVAWFEMLQPVEIGVVALLIDPDSMYLNTKCSKLLQL